MRKHTMTAYNTPYSTVKNIMKGTLITAAISIAAQAKADYHTIDATIGTESPQIRFIDTIKFDKITYDGFNQATKDWYFGDNTIYGNTTIAPLAKLISTQDSIGKVVPGIRVSLPYASLDVGYLNSGVHAKLKAWRHAVGLDWYLTHITNAASKNKPFSLTEIEATKQFGKHAGIVGHASWVNFSGKPKLELGAKYTF